jgi:cob(I)alamin adenosyltransferase
MSLYTKTGDKGLTNLYDMRRIGKESLVLEVLGDLDELSAHIGFACVLCEHTGRETDKKYKISAILRRLQSILLDIGSDIATTVKREKVFQIGEEDVKKLENYIDTFTAECPKLTEFILPGYQTVDAQLHVCRTICRRAERHMWALRIADSDIKIATGEQTFIFMNRLSDFFFAVTRLFARGNEITRSMANSDEFNR